MTPAGQFSFCSTHYLKMCRTGQMRQSSWLKSDRFVSCCQTCFFFSPPFHPISQKKATESLSGRIKKNKNKAAFVPL